MTSTHYKIIVVTFLSLLSVALITASFRYAHYQDVQALTATATITR